MLGTTAKSGTEVCVKATSAAGDISLIGFLTRFVKGARTTMMNRISGRAAAGGSLTKQTDTEMVYGKVKRGRSCAT